MPLLHIVGILCLKADLFSFGKNRPYISFLVEEEGVEGGQ
jgi:hypothetical protein